MALLLEQAPLGTVALLLEQAPLGTVAQQAQAQAVLFCVVCVHLPGLCSSS